jgi:hypothetical protein
MLDRILYSLFGQNGVYRWVGHFTLLRRVSLSMVPKSKMMMGSEKFCDLDFETLRMDVSGFPSLEYLDLEFNNSIRTEPDRLMVRLYKTTVFQRG